MEVLADGEIEENRCVLAKQATDIAKQTKQVNEDDSALLIAAHQNLRSANTELAAQHNLALETEKKKRK
eukprot:12400570-Prorocentrum_lima.AAC.1